MAIVKLVCQSCGGNLDAPDSSLIVVCEYCGTQNQIQRRAPPPKAAPAPPRPSPYMSQPAPPVSHSSQPAGVPKVAKRAIGCGVTLAVLLPFLIIGFVFYIVHKTTSEAFDKFDEIGVSFGGDKSGTPSAAARVYSWQSERPFIADVDGDGVEDVVGLISVRGSPQLRLTAISGSDWSTIFETELGDRSQMPGQPTLRYAPGEKLALFSIGATLRAYDAQTGQERWVASLPDVIEIVMVEKGHLWVYTHDESTREIDFARGKVSKSAHDDAPAKAKLLPGDEGYSLIPSDRMLDIASDHFEGLRVEGGFCPREDQTLSTQWRPRDPKRCTHPSGLAFVVRAKGTNVPFLVGYDRKTKVENWRVQLTPAGTLETVDTGFGQPRAEYVGRKDAIVSFVPDNDDDHPRIRRISMKDGSTKWEQTLNKKLTENVDGMVVGKDRVYVKYGALMVLSLADGTRLTTLGE